MSEIAHATFRGVVGAMAMTGMRVFALHAGLIREDPPSRLTRKRARGLLKQVPRRRRRGATFGLLPDEIRHHRWSGPLFGMLVRLGFDGVVSPALGLTERQWPKGRERAVFMLDHLLFGVVLNEPRSRPRE